jgi:VIT1/CCC1 family predicted Fe2+/Mn2+ transporter
VQAAFASAATFAMGAALPLLLGYFGPRAFMEILVGGGSLVFLALMGALAARTGGASVWVGAARVTLWGALAMAATAAVGALFGTTV